MRKCYVDLDRLIDLNLYKNLLDKSCTKLKKVYSLEPIRKMAENENKRIARKKRGPARLADCFVGKSSSYCPRCDNYVEADDLGVECVECEAYWHYQCAEVTEDEVNALGKQEFTCRMHPKANAVYPAASIRLTTAGSTSNLSKEENILLNAKINPYTLNEIKVLKEKIKNIEKTIEIEAKRCQRQYTVKVNSVTYQLMADNFVKFGEVLGLSVKRPDYDNTGNQVQIQYEMVICNNIPVSVTCFHTTNNILVQLKGTKSARRVNQLNVFVTRDITNLVKRIEHDDRYLSYKTHVRSQLCELLGARKSGSSGPGIYVEGCETDSTIRPTRRRCCKRDKLLFWKLWRSFCLFENIYMCGRCRVIGTGSGCREFFTICRFTCKSDG